MPATVEFYLHRNNRIGATVIYDISGTNLARITCEGREVADGTRAVVVDAFDYSFPFLYRLEDGRMTRSGGRGWHLEEERDEN